MIILIMTTIIIIIIIIFLLPFQLFCRICLAFSFTFHVSRFVFFCQRSRFSCWLDYSEGKQRKVDLLCKTKECREDPPYMNKMLKAWGDWGRGKGNDRSKVERFWVFFGAFLGSFPLKKQTEIMVPIPRVNKIMNGFWFIRSEKKVLFQERGSMLAAFGRNRYRNLWCPRRGC